MTLKYSLNIDIRIKNLVQWHHNCRCLQTSPFPMNKGRKSFFKKLNVVRAASGAASVVLTAGLIIRIGNRKEIRKLKFQGLAFRRSESLS